MSASYDSREDFEQSYPNVKGSAIAQNGELIVLVTKKVPESDLAPHEQIPTSVTINGTTRVTDVMPVGIPHLIALTPPIESENTTPGDHKKRHRPIPGGVSMGNSSIGAGTIGSPLLEHEGDPVVLTNSHVVGTSAKHYQPASMDGGAEENPIGTTREQSELDPGKVQTTDSALIDVDPDIVTDTILGIGTLLELGDAGNALDRTYAKSGRTTNVTEDNLRGRDANVNVAYGPDTIRFTGCDIFGDLSEPGDSGSLIGYKTEDGFVATDLLFAGSSRITVGIPLNAVEAYHGPLRVPDGDENGDGDGGDVPFWIVVLKAIINAILQAIRDYRQRQ